MRFGLLGTGPWAEMAHGPALAQHPEAELVGVWGRRAEAAGALAATLDTRAYDDVDALLADVEAVAISLPPHVQAPLAVRAAAAGCHLLLDKPVATDVAAAREVAAAAAKAQVASVVFFTLRFNRDTAAWIAAQGATEGWLTGHAEWFSPIFGGADTPFSASQWRRDKGALWDVGPHVLSVLLPPLGDVAPGPGAVTAARGPGDMVHLVLRHVSGASSTITVSHTVPPQAAAVTAELRGSAGISTLPERGSGGPVAPLMRAVDALLEAARTGEPHPCDARFGLRVTEILSAAEAALGDQGAGPAGAR